MADNAGLPPIENPSAAKPVLAEMAAPIEDISTAPGSKDVMIGAGVLLIMALLFFFIRNGFVNHLVGKLKRSPNSAGLAGWALFGGLLLASAIGVLALVSKSYLTLLHIVPLALLSLICFVICISTASKK